MKVLIIEDDSLQAINLSRLLKRRNLECEIAETLSEGMALMSLHEFACVVLDLGLPDSDGMDTARRIPEFHPVPVVALTGSDDRSLVAEVRVHGAGYALKPVDPSELMKKVLLSIAGRPGQATQEITQAVVDESRRHAPAPQIVTPWFQRWAPVAVVAISLFSSALAGGAFLYRGIAEQAVQAQKTAEKFKSIDEYVIKSQATIERLAEGQRALQMQAQTSIEDRAGIHRELGMLLQQEREGRADVVKRLERIEDHLLQITKRP